MLETKAGELAGAIWTALNENKEGLTQKALKKVTKIKADKDLFLAIGWLLREDKLVVTETEDELIFALK